MVRLWPDQPDRLLRPCSRLHMCSNQLANVPTAIRMGLDSPACLFPLLRMLRLVLLATHLPSAIIFFTMFFSWVQLFHICWTGVVTRYICHSRPSQLRYSLHWLPVRYHMLLKICTLTYKTLSLTRPAYLNRGTDYVGSIEAYCITRDHPRRHDHRKWSPNGWDRH